MKIERAETGGLSWRIEPLARAHDRAEFSCGNASLDGYIKTQASQDARRYAAAPFVAVSPGSARVLGYYTLSATGVDLAAVPEEMARKLPRYPVVPATLLGRLARDISQQGTNLGEFLLMDALARAASRAGEISAAAVVVDAVDEAAVRFYKRYDFLALSDRPDRLFLPMTTILKLFPDR